ncbi:MAG TPA: TolC family protein [Polyangiaceae bacterium]|nr:TolC family protein [Polyangiaceae bacterium]
MSSVPFSFAGITLALAVSACASTTQTAAPPSESPHSRPSASGATSPSGEVSYAGASDRAVRAAVLDRDAFVRAVLEKNPSLDAARHGIRAAQARIHQAGAFEDPMVDVGIAPLSIGPSRAPFGFEVAVSQKLPWFGKRAFESEASEADAAAAKSDYESVKRELALSAVMLYDAYFVAARSLEINGEHVALMRAIHDNAIAQFGAGRGSTSDALMAETELTHMEHDSMLLATERDVTVAQMNELLHRAPELPLPPPPKELPLPRESEGERRDDTAQAIAQRPDIVAAEQRARAETARAEGAERQSYPDITLSTSYNTMWEMPQHRWMVGVGLNLPFQTGPRSGAADEARAMRSQLLSEAARMTDAARTGAFVARRQLEESKHVLELFERRLLPVARQAIDAARAGFITSQTQLTSVIEAERTLRRLELEYQMRRAEYVRRRAELDRALGRIPGLDWKEERP